MGESLILIVLGLLVSAIGISNMKGNISSIHSYHRKRVTEENRIPFGRTVGLGTVICGASLVLFGALTFVSQRIQSNILMVISSALLIIGLIAGLGISFYGMIKYNKGIF